MSELTLTIMRLGLLALLWLFVVSVVGVLRGDLYGTRVVSRMPRRAASRAARASAAATTRGERSRRDRGRGQWPTHLVVTSGRLAGTSLPLKDTGVLIGRNPECALVLDDDFASGRHARLVYGDSGWVLEDLGSTNGTFIGQQRINGAVPVEAGSVLRIGKTVIELRN